MTIRKVMSRTAKLSDKEYNSLRSDEEISEWVETLIEFNNMDEKERKNFSDYVKKVGIEVFDNSIHLLEELQKDDLLIIALRINKKAIRFWLTFLNSTRMSAKKFHPDRITDKTEISKLIIFLFRRLKKLGLTLQARRVDFMVNIFLENDFESLLTINEQYIDEHSPDELNLRERLRKLDKKSLSDKYFQM